MSLTQKNIERAIRRNFNIKPRPCSSTRSEKGTSIDHVIEDGVEISGLAIASQEASQLNEILKAEGHAYEPVYHFAPNGRWSLLNFNKIKVQWAEKCMQCEGSDGTDIFNIIKGKWKNGIFIPYLLSPKVYAEIIPTDKDQFQEKTVRISSSGEDAEIMIPHKVYKVQQDLDDIKVRFERKTLECVNPRSIMTISVNRQGIYINRKFREKVNMINSLDNISTVVNHYTLNIYYEGVLLQTVSL